MREAKALPALLEMPAASEGERDGHDETDLVSPPGESTEWFGSDDELFRKVRERLASKRPAVAVRLEDL